MRGQHARTVGLAIGRSALAEDVREHGASNVPSAPDCTTEYDRSGPQGSRAASMIPRHCPVDPRYELRESGVIRFATSVGTPGRLSRPRNDGVVISVGESDNLQPGFLMGSGRSAGSTVPRRSGAGIDGVDDVRVRLNDGAKARLDAETGACRHESLDDGARKGEDAVWFRPGGVVRPRSLAEVCGARAATPAGRRDGRAGRRS